MGRKPPEGFSAMKEVFAKRMAGSSYFLSRNQHEKEKGEDLRHIREGSLINGLAIKVGDLGKIQNGVFYTGSSNFENRSDSNRRGHRHLGHH